MNNKELHKTLNNLDWALKHKDHFLEQGDLWKFITSNYLKVKSYTTEDLMSDIEKLKSFDTNNVWNKEFYKLGVMESLSAVSVPTSYKIDSVKRLISAFDEFLT